MTTAPTTTAVPEPLFWTLSHRYTWDDWRVVDSAGVTMNLNSGYLWASPALTDVVQRVVSVSLDLATRYDIDGIHLEEDEHRKLGQAVARAVRSILAG